MKTDASHERVRDADASPDAKRKPVHLPEAFDVGRLDNEVEAPKVLLDVIHVGVALWGFTLAAGVYLFSGQDWRESLLVLGVFAFFLGAWRLAMFVGARRKASKARRIAEDGSSKTPPGERPRRVTPSTTVDPAAATRPVDRSAESTASDREFVSRSP